MYLTYKINENLNIATQCPVSCDLKLNVVAGNKYTKHTSCCNQLDSDDVIDTTCSYDDLIYLVEEKQRGKYRSWKWS